MGESAGDDVCRPVHVDDPDALSDLFADPRVEVIDTIEQQRHELARTLPAPRPELLDEPSRWFHYPWRRSVVHLLGPDGFRALRSDRNRNKITSDEQQQLRELTVTVIGLSSGFAIAHGIVLEGLAGEIRLADFDAVDLSNLNRLPGTVFDLGVNKAVAAARRLAELDPYVRIVVEPAGVNAGAVDAFVDGSDVVIEQCDSFDVKLAVREVARQRRIPILMATADRGLFDVERYDLEPDRMPFHGILGKVTRAELADMPASERVQFVRQVLEPHLLSTRMAASLTEVQRTVSTWPQLGADINLGAATAAAAVRRIGLRSPLPSGRIRIDLDDVLTDPVTPVTER